MIIQLSWTQKSCPKDNHGASRELESYFNRCYCLDYFIIVSKQCNSFLDLFTHVCKKNSKTFQNLPSGLSSKLIFLKISKFFLGENLQYCSFCSHFSRKAKYFPDAMLFFQVFVRISIQFAGFQSNTMEIKDKSPQNLAGFCGQNFKLCKHIR